MKPILALLMTAWVAVGAAHASTGQAGKDIRASLVIQGSISVSEQGRVTAHRIDHPGTLPAKVVALLDRAIPGWTFLPATRDGKPVPVTAKMFIRMVARPLGGKRYQLRLAGTSFQVASRDRKSTLRYDIGQHRPRYPLRARTQGISGKVYLVLRIDRRGHVDKAAVQQVDLMTLGKPGQMAGWRKTFGDAALQTARQWRFSVPTRGELAGKSHWIARIPIEYRMSRTRLRHATYGKWQPYIPGPRHYIAWLPGETLAGETGAPVGGMLIQGQGLKRLR